MGQSENNMQDELIDQLVIKVTDLEKRKIQVPDYTKFFEALEKLLEQWQVDQSNGQAELKSIIEKMDMSQNAVKLHEAVTGAKEILNETRKVLPISHKHHFDLKTKPWIISGVLLLIVTAIATALAFDLYNMNSELKAANIKFRMIKQTHPDIGLWADTTYSNDPEHAESVLSKFEEKDDFEKANHHHDKNKGK